MGVGVNFLCKYYLCLYRGGPPRGPSRSGRPMPYQNNNYSSQNQSVPSSQPIPVQSDSSTKPNSTSHDSQTKSQSTNSTTNTNVTTNSTSSNGQTNAPTSRPNGNSMRGGRSISMRGRGGYNPNINVTGDDMPPQNSQPNKPMFRNSMSRGRGGGFQGPPRSGPIPVANHQGPGGMLTQGKAIKTI